MKPTKRHRVTVTVLLLFLTCITFLGWGGTTFGEAPPLSTAQAEIERRLALDPFAYVAEADYDVERIQEGSLGYSGAAGVVDSETDTLDSRPSAGSSLQGVAVCPDGSRFFMTDAYLPVLHVFDAETRKEITTIDLPGVEPHDPMWMVEALQGGTGTFPYAQMRVCSSHVACTPDGAYALVESKAGLQVVDLATDEVVRTMADLKGGPVAVSFDGRRAYVVADTLDRLPPRGFVEWLSAIMENEDYRLVCLDLQTWEIIGEISTAAVAGLAIKPDDSEVFISETYKKRVRVVGAAELEDRWNVSTEPSHSVGIGFVPDGTKAYVVCSADTEFIAAATGVQKSPILPKAEDYFCGVIDTAGQKIVKRIPLDAY